MSKQKRKLAAIVFTDIVGFTKLTSIDQSRASDLLNEQRSLLKPIVEKNNGTWLKEMGDGLLLIFDTVTDAVNASIGFQHTVKEVDHLNLRIGIHQGEILITNNDVIGDDVNIASRIEPFSAPGGIAISNKVNDALVREKDFETKYVGKPKLKGVGQEVKIFCITSHGLPETKLSDVSAKLETNKTKLYLGIAAALLISLTSYILVSGGGNESESIAVMYMDVNSSDNDDLSYLETLTEDLIFDLSSRSSGYLRVAETATVKKYKNSDQEIQEIAEKMNVDYVFKSSLKPDVGGYHLRCRLYDAYYQKDAFSNKWFIESKNLQSITGVLVQNILQELNIDLLDGYQKIEYNAEAYDNYLRSKNLYAISENEDDNLEAIKLMRTAVSMDENIVMAMLYLGQMLYEIGDEKASVYFERALSKSKSLQDNAGIAESLRKQGMFLRSKKDFDGAINKFSESLAISTVMNDKNSMAKTFNSIAILNYRSNDLDKALQNWLHALSLSEELDDKLKISKYTNNIGIWYRKDNDFSKAIEYYNKSLLIKEELKDNRNLSKTLNNIGEVYFDMGDYVKSIEMFNKSLDIKEKLNDSKGKAASFFNRGKTYFFDRQYENSISDLRQSSYLNKSLSNIQKNNRYIGMSHYYLSNIDSSKFYLEDCYEFYSGNIEKEISILPYLIDSYLQIGDRNKSEKLMNVFIGYIEESEPKEEDYLITNWIAHKIFKKYKKDDLSEEFLENAYLSIKSRSKNIKNKKDRKKYLDTKLNVDIINSFKQM